LRLRADRTPRASAQRRRTSVVASIVTIIAVDAVLQFRERARF
jgi:hypothetical protein